MELLHKLIDHYDRINDQENDEFDSIDVPKTRVTRGATVLKGLGRSPTEADGILMRVNIYSFLSLL